MSEMLLADKAMLTSRVPVVEWLLRPPYTRRFAGWNPARNTYHDLQVRILLETRVTILLTKKLQYQIHPLQKFQDFQWFRDGFMCFHKSLMAIFALKSRNLHSCNNFLYCAIISQQFLSVKSDYLSHIYSQGSFAYLQIYYGTFGVSRGFWITGVYLV